MKTKLTETNVERLKHKSERYDVRDTIERGLLMRVGVKPGSKQWYTFVYRGSKRKMLKLGHFPQMSLRNARLASIHAKNSANAPQTPDHIKTVSDLFEVYKQARESKMRAWRDVQSAWDVWARDRIGHLRLTALTIHNGRDLRNHVSQNSSELRGSAIIRYIRPMFAWAVDESLIDSNPWVGLTANAVARPRDRVLTKCEWLALWEGSFEDTMGAYFRFMMLSAQRKGNVASMRWDEIEDELWTIPAEKFKSTKTEKAKAHEVPLSCALLEIIKAQPRRGEYVFGTTGEKPLSLGSREKDRIGARADVTNWRIHDLRRSGATYMAANRVPRFIVERVLGHADRGVTAIYDRATYRDEKREALNILAGSVAGNS